MGKVAGPVVAGTLLLATPALRAQEGTELTLPQVDVVATAPLGASAARDKVPANTEVLTRSGLTRAGPSDALRTLNERIGGVSLNDAQGNPFQPNLNYRGFEASPLVGNPQGLAVYLNGTRFNAPFGDTTNWDLIPDVAIDRMELSGSNPAFGLNALGGTISVRLRDGFSFHGAETELSGGSFGRIRASAQYGVQSGNWAAYIAGTGLNEDGWREHSPSQLRQIYGDVGYRGDRAEVHFSLAGAVNNLTGNGATPVEQLAVNRAAVFTYPDETRNKSLRAMLSGSLKVSDQLTLQANAYLSVLSQRTLNGDAADAAACADDATLLCSTDGTPYTGRGGDRLPNFLNPGLYGSSGAFANGGPYAILNETATDTTGYGAALQATHRSDLLGRANRLLVGASFDGGDTTFSASSSIGALSLDRDYVGPGIVIDQPDGSIAPVRATAQNRYYGLYGQDALDVTSALTLTLSGRLNLAEIDIQDRNGTALTGNHSFTHFNPAAGATYKILPWLTAYAGYSVANRTPTPAELTCASAESPCSLTNFFVGDPALKQVVAHTLEAGLRGRFGLAGANISWNAGLFRTVSDDDILFTGSEITGRGYFRNVGQTKRQGVEAGLTVRRGPISIYLDYAYTNASFQTAFTAVSQDNPLAAQDGTIQVQRGDQIPGVPQHKLKFGVDWGATPRWTVGLTGVVSSGQVLLGDEANLNPHTDSYFVLNFHTEYRVTDNIELFGLVQNVTDQRYATFGTFSPVDLVPIVSVPNASNTRSLTLGPPIGGWGGVRVRF